MTIANEIQQSKELSREYINLLNGIFYAPNYRTMFPYMAEAYLSNTFEMDNTPESIASFIIAKYWSDYSNYSILAKKGWRSNVQGSFNLKSMLSEIDVFLKLKELSNKFHNKSFWKENIGIVSKDEIGKMGIRHLYTPFTSNHKNPNVFAVATAKGIIKTSDNDTQLTAGCYRYYESDENPIVYLAISHYGISIVVKSWLLIDHYNNNFYGLSTGNGTTTYEKGEIVEERIINTRKYNISEVLKEYQLELNSIDCSKGADLLKEYQFKKNQ